MDRWLRAIGYPTRVLVYLVSLALLWVLAYWWFEPKSLSDRTLASLTVGEITNNAIWAVLSFGGTFMIISGFFADADGGLKYVDWEGWGTIGVWLLSIVAIAALWLAYG